MLINQKVHKLLSDRKKAAESKDSKTKSVNDIDSEIIKEVFGADSITDEDFEAFIILSKLVSAHTQTTAMTEEEEGGTNPKRKIPKSE